MPSAVVRTVLCALLLFFLFALIWQACYGVLHCSLASSSSSSPGELEDTSARDTTELTVPPDGTSYEEYDAIVVS